MNQKPRQYSEFRCYSPMRDALISRISMADDRGAEFYVEIEGEGAAYRRRKAEALEDLVEAIETGLPPGKISRV